MKAINSLASSRLLDKKLIERYSLSESTLIDGAAMGAYKNIRARLYGKKTLFVIGKGNNGSDGLSLARLIAKENNKVSILYVSDDGNSENLKRREMLSYIDRAFDVYGYEVIIDCIFGFGFHGKLDDDVSSLITDINQSGSYIISLDVPSAMMVVANETIAFTTFKLEFFHPYYRFQMGILHCINPGFPENELETSEDDAYLIDNSDLNITPFSISDYKNTRGHLCVIGGSEKYKGAPILAIKSAIKSGTGLATLVSDASVLELAFAHYPSIILKDKESVDLSSYSAIAIGCGWDEGDEYLLDKAIESGKNLVIDADGIKLLKGKKLGFRSIITPHIGEYKRLCKLLSLDDGLDSARSLLEALRKLSKTLEAVIVLKSSTVWITEGESVFIYDGHNPSLGVAGSGDVLTGIIGSLLSSGGGVLSSAINGVIIHQMAGQKAHDDLGFYMAEELIGEIKRP